MEVGFLRWKLTKFSLLVIQTEEINLRGKTMKMVRSVAKSVKTHTIGHLDAEVTLELSMLGLDCCNLCKTFLYVAPCAHTGEKLDSIELPDLVNNDK